MPLYTYHCRHGCSVERYLTLRQHSQAQRCEDHKSRLTQVIQAPLIVKVCADVRYDSPITGAPITTHQARIEDMKRSNCRPYDPEEKTDFHRRQSQADIELDQAIDTHVEAAIERMPTKQRGQLAHELLDKGFTTEYARKTPDT